MLGSFEQRSSLYDAFDKDGLVVPQMFTTSIRGNKTHPDQARTNATIFCRRQEAQELLQDFACKVCGCEMIDSHTGEYWQGGRCALGHALCASCTSKYVELTLLPEGTVWWDTIRCVDPECTQFMRSMSVQRCIEHGLLTRVDEIQLEVVPAIGQDADRDRECPKPDINADLSKQLVASYTKPCPNCSIDTDKYDGCKHVVCSRCKHHYCWICRSEWKVGHLGLGVTCVAPENPNA